jgi:hypothetical protein
MCLFQLLKLTLYAMFLPIIIAVGLVVVLTALGIGSIAFVIGLIVLGVCVIASLSTGL